MSIFLEACCTSLEEVRLSEAGGASRIELCEDLSCGGITPSVGLLKKVLRETKLPVNVLVRPHPPCNNASIRAFILSKEDKNLLIKQIKECKETGAAGIVAGGLLADGSLDLPLLERIVAASSPLPVTFHKAFDACAWPFETLEQIISAGCARILTSGCAPTALEGAELIAKLVRQAGNRIVIMPGGHIRPGNISRISEITKALEYHAASAYFAG